MSIVTKLFKREPTVEDVDRQLAKVDDKIVQYQARRGAIEAELTAAYGDESATEALLVESHKVSLKLSQAQQVLVELETARTEAGYRAIVAEKRQLLESVTAVIQALPAHIARRREAEKPYLEAVDTENTNRRKINSGQWSIGQFDLNHADLPEAVRVQLRELEKEYPLVKQSVARSVAEFEALPAHYRAEVQTTPDKPAKKPERTAPVIPHYYEKEQ